MTEATIPDYEQINTGFHNYFTTETVNMGMYAHKPAFIC